MNEIDLENMLVGQVDALVREMATVIEELEPDKAPMEIDARLYRVLAANCERKAELAEQIAGERARPRHERKLQNDLQNAGCRSG